MARRSVLLVCMALILGIVSVPGVLADIIITASQSCRSDILNPDTNRHDSSKLSVRSDASSAKSWIKFDLGDLDARNIKTATLTISLHEGKSGARNFDVSYVNDNCLDNIDWDERSLTWNNAPGNSTANLGGLDTGKTTLLATVDFADGVPGDAFTIDILEALEADTDGIVQFVLHNSNGLLNFATHDHAQVAWRPFIDVTLGPKNEAKKPYPASGATDVSLKPVLGWTPGGYAAAHDVYLGTVFEDVNSADRSNPKGVSVSQGQTATTFDPAGLAFGQTYYWRVDEVNAPPTSAIYRGSVWSFSTEPYAYPVRPTAATASSFNDAAMMPDKTIDRSGLDASDGHSTTPADMWLSGPTDPGPVWIQYEFDKVYKLYQMWVWNSNQAIEPALGFGAKDVTVEFSQDSTAWTALAGVGPFAQATGSAGYTPNTTVDLKGALARYVRLTIQSNWSTLGLAQRGLSEVRFFQISVYAREPLPASGTAGVALDATLSWRPGREAVRHEVYLGTDPAALVVSKTVTEHEVALSSLSPEYGQTYYWRVTEVNDTAAIQSWMMEEVWSFTTVAYGVVDDFESYNDGCNRVYYAWKSGASNGANADCGVSAYSGNDTGSIVGNDTTPYAERTAGLVHTGNQSMPFWYDNATSPFYSEASREWDTAQSWIRGGANALTLYVRGDPVAYLETGPGSIMMNGIGTDIFGTADQFRFAHKSLSGDGAILARVDGLVDTDPWALAGVMIRDGLDAGSAYAAVFLTGNNGVRFRARATLNGDATSDTSVATAEQMALREPVWIKIERTGNEFRGYYSLDGQVWTAMVWNPQTIVMGTQVTIGLAVTSHNATNATSGRFSGIATTGGVSGALQPIDVGVAQPAGNGLDTLYVVVEDSGGKSKAVSHSDPFVIATGGWEEWNIPLSELTSAGLNPSGVRKVTVGVGNRSAPKSGGAGKLTIDDLRLTRTGDN